MTSTPRKLLIGALIALVAVGVIWFIAVSIQPPQPGKLDAFASCLKDKGALFYGAWWCPHCQNQKKESGNSAHLLPYIECSTPDGQSQNTICTEKGIQSYPTWVFKDGSRLTGEIPLDQLAQKTGCVLPK